MKYLVFGATGNIGSRVAQRLIASGSRPSIFVRNEKKAHDLFGEDVELHIGDLEDPGHSLHAALCGVDRIFLLSDWPNLDKHDQMISAAALQAGVQHIVKLSTFDVLTGIGTGTWHAQGEDAIRESGIAFSFVRAAGFMSNVLSWSYPIRNDGVLRSSTGDGTIALIHPDDVAAVATTALTTSTHVGEALAVTGPEALSYREMADAIGAAIGKPIEYEEISDEEAYRGAVAWSGEGPYADALVDIWRAVREGRLDTVTDGARRVTGREPIRFAQWTIENAASFR